MPRRSAGPRLWLDKGRQQWAIRDGAKFIRTGCGAIDRGEAEKQLQAYIGKKHTPTPSGDPLIDEVLAAYGTEQAPTSSRPRDIGYYLANLLRFWSGVRVSEITARKCRAYASSKTGTINDLKYLKAAVRYWHREYGPLASIPAIVLPKPHEPRDRWLTRSEAARLLWAARRNQALKRFILLGLYTGSRSNVILSLQWDWLDLQAGTMRRRQRGEAEKGNKRRPPVRLGKRLLAHLRRWRDMDGPHISQFTRIVGLSKPQVRRAWAKCREEAGVGDATPHTLRHTRATWLMQAGVPIWEAAGHLGMTPAVLQRVYGHHHPDFQKMAAEV